MIHEYFTICDWLILNKRFVKKILENELLHNLMQ